MNRIHNLICSSGPWRARVEQRLLPWGLDGLELTGEVLELGPGFGATTRVLASKVGKLSVLEVEEKYCRRLSSELGEAASVTQGDATNMPYPNARFSAVLCFTMLHHITSRELQDRVFSEASRVLSPGGVFAGTDSIGTGYLFKLIHIGDTLLTIDPQELPRRLRAAGLTDPQIERRDGSFRFRARKPLE